jgi:hypothetical protein
MSVASSRKRTRLVVAGTIIAVIIITAVLVEFFPPARSGPLKENLWTKSFDDQQGLLSLDAIIQYETEEDGTWRRLTGAKYNTTVLVKPTYVKESDISKVNVIRWTISGIDHASGGWPYLSEELPPIDYGIELMGIWLNQSAWQVASDVFHVDWPYYAPREPNATWTVSFWFVIREILTNGTSRILNWGDSLFIYWSG